MWAEKGKCGLLDITPIKVEMEKGIPLVRIKQYPMSAEGKMGLAPII